MPAVGALERDPRLNGGTGGGGVQMPPIFGQPQQGQETQQPGNFDPYAGLRAQQDAQRAPAPPPRVAAPPIVAPTLPAATGVPSTATFAAQTDPNLSEYLKRVKARLDDPQSDTRALNQAGEAINQFAQGQRNQTMGDFARRGVLGNAGSEQAAYTDIGNVAQGQFGKAAEGIAIARQNANDAMLQGAAGAFSEPGRQGLADRSIGVQAAGQQGQLAMQGAQMQMNAQLANANLAQQAQQNAQAQQLAQAQMAQQQMLAMANLYANIYR